MGLLLVSVLGYLLTDGQPAWAFVSGDGSSGQVLADTLSEYLDLGLGALTDALLPATLLSLGLTSDQGPYIQTISYALHQCAGDISSNGGFPPWLSADFLGSGSWGSLYGDGWDSACDPMTIFPELYPASAIAQEPWQGNFCASVQVWDGGGYWPPTSTSGLSGTTWSWLTDSWVAGHLWFQEANGSDHYAFGDSANQTAANMLAYINTACPPAWLSFVYGAGYVTAGSLPTYGNQGGGYTGIVGDCNLDVSPHTASGLSGTGSSGAGTATIYWGVDCQLDSEADGLLLNPTPETLGGTLGYLYFMDLGGNSEAWAMECANSYGGGEPQTVAAGESTNQTYGYGCGFDSGGTTFRAFGRLVINSEGTYGGCLGGAGACTSWTFDDTIAHGPFVVEWYTATHVVWFHVENATNNGVVPGGPPAATTPAASPAPAQSPPTIGSGTSTVTVPTGLPSAPPPAVSAAPISAAPGAQTIFDPGDNVIVSTLVDGFNAVVGVVKWLGGETLSGLAELDHDIASELSTDISWLENELAPLLQGIWDAEVSVLHELEDGFSTLDGDLQAVESLLSDLQTGITTVASDVAAGTSTVTSAITTGTTTVTSAVTDVTTTIVSAPTLTEAGLETLFEPSTTTVTDTETQLTDSPPMEWLGLATGGVDGVITGIDGGLSGGLCAPYVGWSGQVVPSFGAYLMTPDSACPGNGPGHVRTAEDQTFGSLDGWRPFVRGLALFVLAGMIVMRILRAAPWSTEPDDLGPSL